MSNKNGFKYKHKKCRILKNKNMNLYKKMTNKDFQHVHLSTNYKRRNKMQLRV